MRIWPNRRARGGVVRGGVADRTPVRLTKGGHIHVREGETAAEATTRLLDEIAEIEVPDA